MPPDHTPDLSDNPAMDRVPSVSVVIPAWNRRETLRMSVESVLRQSYEDFELIVVDDGSSDGTMEAIADITDPRLRRLSHEQNKGVSAARNTGIRAARAEWVAFNDSDDEWLPLKLEKQMARLAEAGPEVVGCYTGVVHVYRPGSDSQRTYLKYSPDARRQVLEGDLSQVMLHFSAPPASIQTIVVRRDVLLKIGGFDEDMSVAEDWECNYRIARQGHYLFLDEPLVKWESSSNSLSRDTNKLSEGVAFAFRKHLSAISRECPEALTKHYIVLAGMERRRKELAAARDALQSAARLQPLSLGIRLRQARLLGDRLKHIFKSS